MNSRALSTIFIGLTTYSVRGGIQRFNQRVIKTLCENAKGVHHARFVAITPESSSVEVTCRSGCHVPVRSTVSIVPVLLRLPSASTLLIGHINLLPIAILYKAFHPRCRLFLFVHGDEAWGVAGNRRRRVGERTMLRLVDKVLAVSRHTADLMSMSYRLPSTRCTIFPNVIEVPSETPDRAEAVRPRVLIVSRLDEGERRKNVDKVIKALRRVRLIVPDVVLTIVGKGHLTESLFHYAEELGVSDIVEFIQDADDSKLSALYKAATIFALPSDKEGFGIVYLEAWRVGVPVICSVNSAPSEFIENNVDGWIVDPANDDELVAAIVDGLQNREKRDRLGLNGFRKTKSRFNADDFGYRLMSALED